LDYNRSFQSSSILSGSGTIGGTLSSFSMPYPTLAASVSRALEGILTVCRREGVYDITVELESYRFRDTAQRITVRRGQQILVTLHEQPDTRRVQLLDNIDSLTAAVLDNPQSLLDGTPARNWLTSSLPRPPRQACLLNVLAKLRVPPDPTHGLQEPLTSAIEFVYFADVDRTYAAAKPELSTTLDQLVSGGLWASEGTPKAPIHHRLLESLTRIGVPADDAHRFQLGSFRQGGRNSLQIVVASPPAGFPEGTLYVDLDIDLGNPLWDLEGLIIHIGELLDSGKTDHLSLHKALAKGDTKDFLYYDVIQT